MDSQRFHVKILLKLEAVTCPGVWLCSHGYLEVTIKALGYFFRTGAMEPFFPLLCHDRFKIEGFFKNTSSIADLVNNLRKEHLEVTLWQNGRRLSYYQGTMMELLQYIEPKLKCPHSNTAQLLMKTTTAFPGIIAPKVEISSEFYIKDKILNISSNSQDLKNSTNLLRKSQNISSKSMQQPIKRLVYQRPCTMQTLRAQNFLQNTHLRQQKPVCHTRKDLNAANKCLNESICTKSAGRRVSIDSSCSSNNTHTSVGIYDLEPDLQWDKFDEHNHHDHLCQLCRLYREVFLQ